MSASACATPGRAPNAPPHGPTRSRLWWWVVAAFAVQLAAWVAWFAIASQHKVEEVPLAGEVRDLRR